MPDEASTVQGFYSGFDRAVRDVAAGFGADLVGDGSPPVNIRTAAQKIVLYPRPF